VCANLAAARACYEEALERARAVGSDEFIGLCLDGLGAVAAKRGDWARAARMAGAAGARRESSGATLDPADRAFRERYLDEARATLGEARLEAAIAEGGALTLEQALREASERSDTESG
jgi:hypothetical protein